MSRDFVEIEFVHLKEAVMIESFMIKREQVQSLKFNSRWEPR